LFVFVVLDLVFFQH